MTEQKQITCRPFIRVCMKCMNNAAVPESSRPALFLYNKTCDLCNCVGTCYHLTDEQMQKIIDLD